MTGVAVAASGLKCAAAAAAAAAAAVASIILITSNIDAAARLME